MSQNDSAVLTAAVGYVYIAAPGTPRPSPSQLESIDPETFGSSSSSLKASAVPTGGTFALTVGEGTVAPKQAVTAPATAVATDVDKTAEVKTAKAVAPVDGKAAPTGTTLDLAFDAGSAEVQTALENIEGIGVGQIKVTGEGFAGDGFVVAFIGTLAGENVAVTVTSKLQPATVTVASDVVGTPNGWQALGHTSRDDLPEWGFDGGDTEVRGTWQNESLREVVTKPIADYLTLFLAQFDQQTLELFYGEDSSSTPGVFGVRGGTPVPAERALWLVIVDGDTKIGFYAPKTSIRRDDSIQMAVDEFATFPVKATFLKFGSSNVFEWVNAELFD
jgi:hypothetical protein